MGGLGQAFVHPVVCSSVSLNFTAGGCVLWERPQAISQVFRSRLAASDDRHAETVESGSVKA